GAKRCGPAARSDASRSARARPGLALADDAAERAALELEAGGALQRDAARVGLAVLGVVDLTVPLVGAGRLHAEHDLHADHRPAALGGVGIVLVGLRASGRRIVGLLERDDRAAQLGTAIGDAHGGLATLGVPVAERVRGEGGGP